MSHKRAFFGRGGDERLDSFRDRDRAPASYAAHKGICGCGVETSRRVILGPPGHPENGWECSSCGELRLRFEMEQANRDPRRI